MTTITAATRLHYAVFTVLISVFVLTRDIDYCLYYIKDHEKICKIQ
jgi:hypothetical protein